MDLQAPRFQGFLCRKHNPTGSWFLGQPATLGTHFCERQAQVGNDPRGFLESELISWGELLEDIQRWSSAVFEWANTPDLWAMPDSAAILAGLTSETSNTPFTLEEQKAISARLEIIAGSIKKTYDLTAEQEKKLDEKFEEIKKDSKRLGRKDLKNVVLGGVFSLILTDVITPGASMHILMLIEHGIGHLFMGNPPSIRGILNKVDDLVL